MNYTTHFLIPFETGAHIRPKGIIADVTNDTPFMWFDQEVNTKNHKTWVHYIIGAETEDDIDELTEQEIAKLDAIKAPYYMLYMGKT